MKFTEESILEMHELIKRKENEEEILVGRTDISNFVVLPPIGVEIIELFEKGLTIAEVGHEIEKRLGEPVDMFDFVQNLISDYQFVYKIDGVVVNEKIKRKDHFPWITENVGRFFFNRTAFILYTLLFVSGMMISLVQKKYFPVYSDIFISSSVTISMLASFSATWFFLFIHELGHLMAARSLGIGSRIGLSHRLVFAVAETDMSNIVLVPRPMRYRALFAGIAWDMALFGIGVWLQFMLDLGWLNMPSIIISYIKLVNFTLLMGLAFQLMFFLRTDIYYVFTTKFECANLMGNTLLYLRKFVRPLTENENTEWEYVAEHEKRIIRWYKWFYIAGIIWALWFFATYTVRQAVEFIVRISTEMKSHPVLSWAFLDGILLILIAVIPFMVALWSWTNTWRVRRKELLRQVQNLQ